MEDLLSDPLHDLRELQAAAANEAGQAVAATILGIELPGLRTFRKGVRNEAPWFEPSDGPASQDRATAEAAGAFAERAVRKADGTLPGVSCGPARDLVRQNWPAITRVAQMLMGRWGREGLTQADVADIIRVSPGPAFGEGL